MHKTVSVYVYMYTCVYKSQCGHTHTHISVHTEIEYPAKHINGYTRAVIETWDPIVRTHYLEVRHLHQVGAPDVRNNHCLIASRSFAYAHS